MRKTARVSLLLLSTLLPFTSCSLRPSSAATREAPVEAPPPAATELHAVEQEAPPPPPSEAPAEKMPARVGLSAPAAPPSKGKAEGGMMARANDMGPRGAGGFGDGVMAERKVAAMPSTTRPPPMSKPVVVAEPVQARSGLQGGSKDDVGQRQDYLRYTHDMAHVDAHPMDISQRVMITARDDMEQTLPNAQVTVKSGTRTVYEGTTYANGRNQFFPRAMGLTGQETVQVTLTSQGHSETRELQLTGKDQDFSVVVPALAQRKHPVVDVMFVLDTTGSMGDEIARIQLTLLDVAARIQKLEPSATVRYGLTLYRDRGDAYVTQVKDFTTNVQAFLAELQAVEADGGGDTPESLNEALHVAINSARWTPATTPNAVRMAILVADAPPHLDYEQDHDYAKEMKVAQARGIKVFPVAASGLDDQGEFIFRQLAHHTMGRFVFITYGGGTSHHVGQFANNNLDDLVVGLVADEMADLTGRPRAQVRALAMAR
jgi:Mg-chelatase subunit ChlD